MQLIGGPIKLHRIDHFPSPPVFLVPVDSKWVPGFARQVSAQPAQTYAKRFFKWPDEMGDVTTSMASKFENRRKPWQVRHASIKAGL